MTPCRSPDKLFKPRVVASVYCFTVTSVNILSGLAAQSFNSLSTVQDGNRRSTCRFTAACRRR